MSELAESLRHRGGEHRLVQEQNVICRRSAIRFGDSVVIRVAVRAPVGFHFASIVIAASTAPQCDPPASQASDGEEGRPNLQYSTNGVDAKYIVVTCRRSIVENVCDRGRLQAH